MNKLIFSTGLKWFWLILIIFIIDLFSKYLVLKNLRLGEKLNLFSSINICYVRNYGAAFSLLSGNGGWQRVFFTIIAIVVCIIILLTMYNLKATQRINNIACAMIVGGSLGNIFDRLYHGFVIDMIDFYIGNWHFAIFNLADSSICIGVILIIIKDLIQSFNKRISK